MREQFFQQPSVMSSQQHFSEVPTADIPRSRFDRSHAHKTTFDAGNLIPVFVDEVLPGDTFDLNATVFARLATPLKPIMDNIYLDVHFFFVPYRLVWSNWEEFCGQRTNPTDDPTLLSIPQIPFDLPSTDSNTIARYFGLPINAFGLATTVSALPFRAYRLIWNEWYRDQNLQSTLTFSLGDGPESASLATTLLPRGKRHDYFTSCLPWPQKGNPVIIPLGSRANVLGIGTTGTTTAYLGENYRDANNQPMGSAGPNEYGWLTSTASSTFIKSVKQDATGTSYPDVYADLSNASAISINALRNAVQIQRLLERDARGGTRYIELILAHFGVRSPDARLQRPEYLGGGTTRITVNPIASTAYTTQSPQANLAGVGAGVNRSGFTKSFTEHGVIIGLASARADLTYQNGIERMWSRKTRYDFYWPALAHLGEQAVLNKEIFATGTVGTGPTADDGVFGYQERYAEYRYKPSRVTGIFNSNVTAPLDVWHLAQDFSTLPVLNPSFIVESPPIDRIIAVPSEPHFLADIWFDLKCDRPMPVYSVPGLMDHF